MALLAVLVPLILTLHGRVVAESGELRRDLLALTERVARSDGAWEKSSEGPLNKPEQMRVLACDAVPRYADDGP